MGHVEIHRDFSPAPGGTARTLRIYTPDAYDREPERRFPVLYMHDGQNVFSHPESARYDTWGANDAIEQLAAEGRCEPWLVVAVDHGPERISDYSPWDEPALGVTGRGDATLRWFADELKPWVDRTYRTRPEPQQTAMAGSSLGGLLSLYAGLSRPEVYGRIGALSPTMLWSVAELERRWPRPTGRWSRIYLDVGTFEGVYVAGLPMDYASAVHRFWQHLERAGYQPWELKLVVEQNGTHDEASWRRRLPEALAWLLGSW